MKAFFQKNWVHAAIIALFFILTYFYFSPQFDGNGLRQHDIEQYIGMSKELKDYHEKTGEYSLWTNSMFGGMPSFQVLVKYQGNIVGEIVSAYLKTIPPPAGIVFLYMVCFYIFALCLRINPWVGMLGAIAFGFSSYDIIIIQAGHNSKALAVAFMAPVVGAFIMAYQRNLRWGIILSALFMTLEISMNHLQVTYYLGILMLFLGLVMLVDAIRKKAYKNFIIASAGVLVAYLLAVGINYGNISLTNQYAKHSIRGGNDITLNPDGTSNAGNATTGLDKDDVTRWSYGIGESFTLISPYVKGGGTMILADSPFAEDAEKLDLSTDKLNAVMNYPVYWGDQPMTSGPVYVGIIVAFLAFLALIFVKNPVKWALLAATVLTLALSWGKNFMGLTDFFLENIPGYNKFRAVTIILVIVELCIPILGVLFLNYMVKERESLVAQKKKFFIASGGFFAFLLIIKMVGLGDNYMSAGDKDQFARIEEAKQNIKDGIKAQVMQMDPAQQQQYGVNTADPAQMEQFINAQYEQYVTQNNLQQLEISQEEIKTVRESIFNSSMNRSLLFCALAIGLLSLLFLTQLPSLAIVGGLAVVVALDLIPVANNYLGKQELGSGYKYWDSKANTMYPISAAAADLQILEIETSLNPSLKSKVAQAEKEGQRKANELGFSGKEKNRVVDSYKFAALNSATNYRVFDVNGNFSSAQASYFHKSLGGYHGAKLRNVQNVFEYHLSKNNNKVYDILNVKYFIQSDDKGNKMASPNMTAMGTAWFVKNIDTYDTPNDEIRALGNQFEVKNIGQGQLVVNGEVKTSAKIYGSESLRYVLQGDSINVPMSNGMSEGMEAVFVMDVNGKTNLVPKMTLDLDTAKSFLKLTELKVVNEFRPREEAVMLKSEAAKLSAKKFSGEGRIEMSSYAPNKITYKAEANGKQFAVFSEIYYPEGWSAKIDGKEVDIRKTDYLLRGLEIPSGKHTIEFSFDVPKFHSSNKMALILSLVLLLGLGGMAVFELIKSRKSNGGVQ
ncbi:MAG: hypothetical protein K0R65_61 [Crocinitomicaceae bacterium]|jgi:hypothetical protein|nr:hypothetical protein [Crocinitomicaceae bacterium]